MKLLLDTHLLLWMAVSPKKLSRGARGVLDDPQNELLFSVASIWEVAIRSALGRSDFAVDVRQFRRGLLENDYEELPVLGSHAVITDALPAVHRDPFDRMLVAQAKAESLVLLTVDQALAQYGAPVRLVQ